MPMSAAATPPVGEVSASTTAVVGTGVSDGQVRARIGGITGMSLYKNRRRAEAGTVPLATLLEDWRRLPESEREAYENEARERRVARITGVSDGGGAAGTAKLLRRTLEAERVASTVEPIDLRANPSAKRRRKEAPQLSVVVPRPVFPRGRDGGARDGVGETTPGQLVLAQRRRHDHVSALSALRSQVAERETRVTVESSCGVDLSQVAASLTGPVLTCDWQQRSADDDDDAESEDGLTVDLPVVHSGKADSEVRRNLLRQDLNRKITSAQVRTLLAPAATASASAPPLAAAAAAMPPSASPLAAAAAARHGLLAPQPSAATPIRHGS